MKNSGFALYKSPYGLLKIEYDGQEVLAIKIVSSKCEGEKPTEVTDKVCSQLSEYFTGRRRVFDFTYKLTGTDFQRKVWKELRKIPYGETRSYKEIAAKIGNANASRAVGAANNKNPIAIVVPCHRVVGADGNLVGYAGGIEMKKSLLELEKNNIG